MNVIGDLRSQAEPVGLEQDNAHQQLDHRQEPAEWKAWAGGVHSEAVYTGLVRAASTNKKVLGSKKQETPALAPGF